MAHVYDPGLVLHMYPDELLKFGASHTVEPDDAVAAQHYFLCLSADAKAGPLTISGLVRYQMCDDRVCFAPERAPWKVETKVVAAGRRQRSTRRRSSRITGRGEAPFRHRPARCAAGRRRVRRPPRPMQEARRRSPSRRKAKSAASPWHW